MPASGTIEIDGRDSTDFSLEELRGLLAYMPQGAFLFSSSIRENITFGRPAAEEAELAALIQLIRMRSDMETLPDGLDTRIGERGVLLSGGQRQRLALARCLLLEAPLLLLDDPFSSVDMETEAHIIESLMQQRRLEGRTTLFSTHRFSLASRADRVLLLESGQLIASGSHQQLMEESRLYQSLTQVDTDKDSIVA
jgi:ATP-binding cassette subfamily B protein